MPDSSRPDRGIVAAVDQQPPVRIDPRRNPGRGHADQGIVGDDDEIRAGDDAALVDRGFGRARMGKNPRAAPHPAPRNRRGKTRRRVYGSPFSLPDRRDQENHRQRELLPAVGGGASIIEIETVIGGIAVIELLAPYSASFGRMPFCKSANKSWCSS